eukprot:COSAG06_NODE_3602_length_5131_cov_10.387122_2_plen_91_part_00
MLIKSIRRSWKFLSVRSTMRPGQYMFSFGATPRATQGLGYGHFRSRSIPNAAANWRQREALQVRCGSMQPHPREGGAEGLEAGPALRWPQ